MKINTTELSPEAYYQLVGDTFREHGKPDVAQGQMRYMRNQFDFFGLKMPDWVPLTRKIHLEQGLPDEDGLKKLARLCFADDHREVHYFAIESVQVSLKNVSPEFIEFLEELILEKSWWDTVDWLAKLTGLHFRRFPALTRPVTERWMDSGELWLQRVCLIFQLLYRDKTDSDLLFEYVRRLSSSKAFFIQKGAGWALRQYSKTNPEAVRQFIASTPLAPLTAREALKWMNSHRMDREAF